MRNKRTNEHTNKVKERERQRRKTWWNSTWIIQGERRIHIWNINIKYMHQNPFERIHESIIAVLNNKYEIIWSTDTHTQTLYNHIDPVTVSGIELEKRIHSNFEYNIKLYVKWKIFSKTHSHDNGWMAFNWK